MVERIAIADQDAKRSLRSRRRDMDGNVLHDAFATIRTQQSFNGDVVPRSCLRNIGAGALQPRPAPFADDVEIKLYAVNGGDAVRIVEDAAEAFAQRDGG